MNTPFATPNLNLRPLSRSEVRGLDALAAETLGLPTIVLMENAGRGAAALSISRTTPSMPYMVELTISGSLAVRVRPGRRTSSHEAESSSSLPLERSHSQPSAAPEAASVSAVS